MVQIEASLGVELGSRMDVLGRRMTGVERAMLRPPAQPFTFRQEVAGVTDTVVSDLVLDLGRPMSGKFWYVMGCTVGGRTYASVVGGTALLVVSRGGIKSAADVGIAAVYDQAASLPSPAGYSRGQIVVRPDSRVMVIIVGGTASTGYTAAATIEEYEDGPRDQTAAA